MARNPDGTFQQGDPETRQAAQKGGQASHGRKQGQMQQEINKNRPQQQGGTGPGNQQSQSQQAKRQMGSPSSIDSDNEDLSLRRDRTDKDTNRTDN